MKKFFKCSIAFAFTLIAAFAVNILVPQNAETVKAGVSDVSVETNVNKTGTLASITSLKQIAALSNSVQISYDAVLAADSYNVQMSANKVNWTDMGYTSSTTPNITGLSAGKTYYVRTRAYSKDYVSGVGYVEDYGAWSAPITVVTTPDKVDSTTIKHTTSTETSLTLTWGKVTGADGYKVVYYKKGTLAAQGKTKWVTTNSVKLTGLSKNTDYDFDIYSYRNGNQKYVQAYAAYIYTYVSPTPTAISGLKLYSCSKGSASFEWNTNKVADGYKYIVYDKNKKKVTSGTTTSSSYVNISSTKIKAKQFYSIKICGYINVAGNKKVYGKYSALTYFAVQPSMSVKRISSGVNLSWDKVSGATSYKVYISKEQTRGYKLVGTTTKNNMNITKFGKNGKALVNNQYYYVYVVAEKKVGSKKYLSDDSWCKGFYIY